MAWATLMKLRKALVERQLESVTPEVFQELGNMDQTPIQHEIPVETTLERRGAKDARISTGGEGHEKERFTLCLAVMADGSKVPLRIIFKGMPFIPPATPGKGTRVQPRKGTSFGVQEKSWCDARECTLWTLERWKLRPNNGSIIKQRRSILVLDDFKCHRDEAFITDLLKRCNTIVILIPGGLTPLLQPLDRMLNKQMKRLMRGKYVTYTATAVEDPKTGKLKPPGRGKVSTWCNESWAAITPEVVKTCLSTGSRSRSTAARTTRGSCTTSVKDTVSFSSSSASRGRQHIPVLLFPRFSYRRYPRARRSATTPSRQQRRSWKESCYPPAVAGKATAM
ncbi:unnamed protein product [Ascophyllum nodosum]